MLLVREVLRRWRRGEGKKRIARELGLDPKTVRRYLDWAKEASAETPGSGVETGVPVSPSGPSPDTSCGEEELDAIVAAVVRRKEAGGRPRGAAWELCLQHRDLIEALLETEHVGRRLTLKKVGQLLARKRKVSIPYATLHRFAVSVLGHGKKRAGVPVADGDPGKELQLDTGWVGELEERPGAKRRFKAWIFTAAFSRHRFVYPIARETTEEAIEACEAAWGFFGGVFEVVIPDNTKAIVADADPLDPKFVRAFLEYSQKRDFLLDPTRVRHPKDKPRVERSVRHVREACFAGERLESLDDARSHAAQWCLEEYGLERHGTKGWRPRVKFEEDERPALKPKPTAPYDKPTWTEPRVQRDQYAQVARALYSLPAQYVGRTVDARADSQTVRFYLRGELIKAHPRVAEGERSTDKSDFPAEALATGQRDTAFFLARAKELGEWVGKYAEALLDSPLPWSRMRQVHALLRLPKRYGVERVEAACRTALEIELLNVARLERVIQLGAPAEPTSKPPGRLIAFSKYQRPASDYALPRGAPQANTSPTEQEGRA